MVSSRIKNVESKNKELRRQIENLEEIKIKLQQLGIDTEYISKYRIENQLENVKKLIPDDFVRICNRLQECLLELIPKLPEEN